jgi:predicted nucleic acid-binding protein
MGPLVDTSVIVDAYAGRWTAEVGRLDTLMLEGGTPAIAPIVLQEVLQGGRDDRDLHRIARHMSAFEPLAAPSYELHEHAAEIFRRVRRGGLTSSTVDVLIVALAAANRRPLLTSDVVQRRVATLAGVELA